jgi:hypothetical protein
MTYVVPRREAHTHTGLKRRIYNVVTTFLAQGKAHPIIPIQRKFPGKEWGRVWGTYMIAPYQMH